ncbi:MarR family winged helix-turn-helix transcriptional regulator [Curtobacterium oceanosedimentum]|uniref:MarR family winged helix-turn-helix transcriptional regulator n=1 Tax=Curtobacterium oceanosedimentum TaxID=465820 RepID=UPI001CE07ACA|nr:MarR family transcriptional regulator [Curtobacterium oceanosedimentum]MCA5924753.1 MarR family transcriptional regulator [Curtobacterium oceanosedimentum]
MPLTVVRREHVHLYAREPRSAAARTAVDALLRLQHAEDQQIESARIESGLSKNEFLAVRYLLQAHRDGRVTGPKDLAVMLAVSNASVTKIVDGLVQQGLLSRTAHPTDRRAQVLAPTDRAAEKIDASYAPFHEAVVEVLDRLSDADNAVLADSLTKVVEALAAGSPAPADEYTVDHRA